MTKKFKLQPVLNYRSNIEAEARRWLAESLERELAASRKITETRNRLHVLCRELDERQRKGIASADLMLHKAGIEGLEALLRKQEGELERLQHEVIECRGGLSEASRDKKVLERLKEKIGEEERQFQNRRENILLDEISLRFGKGE